MIGMRHLLERGGQLGVRRLGVLTLLLLASGQLWGAVNTPHPLEPLDIFTPRGTILTLTRSVDATWERFSAKDPTHRQALMEAIRCLDLGEVPPGVASALGGEGAILLKEILDRTELPPTAEIPGEAELRDQDLETWTIPHTEIQLARVATGPHQGEFLFSQRTVRRLPEFYAKVRHLPYRPGKQGGHYDEIRSGALSPALGRLAARLPAWTRHEFGKHLVWQWSVVILAILTAIGLAALVFRLGRRLAAWEQKVMSRYLFASILFPLTVLGLTVVLKEVLRLFIRLAGAPYYLGTLALTAIADLAIAWVIGITLTRASGLLLRYSRTAKRPLNAQLVHLSLRVLTIFVVAGYLFFAAESLGLPVPALIAGLGVGGLAMALATQSTLENLIGGLILHADQPVRVGEFLRFGDKMGTVEDVGIRSARIRTVDRTLLVVPNAELVRMQLENFSRRDRVRLSAMLRLRMETTPDQMRYLLTRLQQMLREHPGLADDGLNVRFVGIGEYALDVELVAMASTADWSEFLAIRQDILLRAMNLVEEAGTRLAVPVHIEFAGSEAALDEERRRHAEDTARRWRDEGRLDMPEYGESK